MASMLFQFSTGLMNIAKWYAFGFFFTSNHYAMAYVAAGAMLVSDPIVMQVGGERVLLMHGDSLCTLDVGYMKLRRWLRNPVSLFILRNLPLSRRHQLARKLRKESRAQTRMKASEIVDVTPEEVLAVMRRYGVRTLIHGHTHRPAVHHHMVDGKRCERWVLADWYNSGSYLRVDAGGCRSIVL